MPGSGPADVAVVEVIPLLVIAVQSVGGVVPAPKASRVVRHRDAVVTLSVDIEILHGELDARGQLGAPESGEGEALELQDEHRR